MKKINLNPIMPSFSRYIGIDNAAYTSCAKVWCGIWCCIYTLSPG